MEKAQNFLPRVVIFLAGVAAGALTLARKDSVKADPDASTTNATANWKEAIASLETRLNAHEAANSARCAKLETRLDEHAAKLAEVPSTAQIVAAMEQLLAKTMTSLDDRLTTQAHSIEVLRTTVSQTDSLLERVLESLDSLQTYTEPPQLEDDELLRPA
jgi:chromosome segregation ATPase